MHPKVIGKLLVRIAARGVSGNDGGISVRRTLLDLRQRGRHGTALCSWNLHVILARLNTLLHAGYKLLIAQEYLMPQVEPRGIRLDAVHHKFP